MPIEQYTKEEIEQGFTHLENKLRDIICEVQGEIKADVQDSVRRAISVKEPESEGTNVALTVFFVWLIGLTISSGILATALVIKR